MNVLVLNPGGNSLKVQIVVCDPAQTHAYQGEKPAAVGVEGIGKDAKFLIYEGRKVVHSEPIEARDYGQALDNMIPRIEGLKALAAAALAALDCVGLRVVHGGANLTEPTEITAEIEQQIVALAKLAPLHNKSSIEVLEPARRHFAHVPIYGVFDTVFHRSIPEHASTYAIPLSSRESTSASRRYGFHGISAPVSAGALCPPCCEACRTMQRGLHAP